MTPARNLDLAFILAIPVGLLVVAWWLFGPSLSELALPLFVLVGLVCAVWSLIATIGDRPRSGP
jgi:hypothetical protein